jgi:hypothetical protein
MDAANGNSLAATGFLTALEDPAHGWFGGYLLLSQLGRPLEFHCTTPIEPTRAQQILYGPTLQSHLLGEVIGRTLVRQPKLPVQAVLTDCPEMLNLSLYQQGVVACVEMAMGPNQGKFSTDWNVEESAPRLELGNWQLYGTSTCNWQVEQLRQQLTPMVEHIDLLEPFQRIRAAILEAQRISAVGDEVTRASSIAA